MRIRDIILIIPTFDRSEMKIDINGQGGEFNLVELIENKLISFTTN